MKIKRIMTIMLFSICIMFVITTEISAATQSFPGIPPNMYDCWGTDSSTLFSSQQGAPLGWYDQFGNPSTATVYETSYTYNANVEPSVGYAYYLSQKLNTFNKSEMQKIIWASGQWSNESNMINAYTGITTQYDTSVVPARSYQYGTVYYGIFKDAIENYKDIFLVSSAKESINVMVDQDSHTYTVGPYRLKLNVNHNSYTDEAGKILYNELIGEGGGNLGYSDETSFAKFNEIEGLNGDNKNAIFINENGKTIKFPNFNSEEIFYIRFTPNDNGEIKETGNPVIKVKYLTQFNTNKNLIKYNPLAVQFGGSAGDYKEGDNAKIQQTNYFESETEDEKFYRELEESMRDTSIKTTIVTTLVVGGCLAYGTALRLCRKL